MNDRSSLEGSFGGGSRNAQFLCKIMAASIDAYNLRPHWYDSLVSTILHNRKTNLNSGRSITTNCVSTRPR
jgi:hypothetical protein